VLPKVADDYSGAKIRALLKSSREPANFDEFRLRVLYAKVRRTAKGLEERLTLFAFFASMCTFA
jgi:hypothetical protein